MIRNHRMGPVMRCLLPLFLSMSLAGCVNQLVARQAWLNQFIGHSEPDLVKQLGVPSRSYETGGVKYLAYDESRVELLPSMPHYGFGPWWAGSYGGGFPPQVVYLVCETTFSVADGVVKSYTLRGNACG